MNLFVSVPARSSLFNDQINAHAAMRKVFHAKVNRGGEGTPVASHDQRARAARTNIGSENVDLHRFQARYAPKTFASGKTTESSITRRKTAGRETWLKLCTTKMSSKQKERSEKERK